MASGLATRCPACGTVFRVVQDQLRVSEGWVRCGRCAEVFDASKSLSDIETGEPRRGFDGVGRALEAPPPAPAMAWMGSTASQPVYPPEPAREPEPEPKAGEPAVDEAVVVQDATATPAMDDEASDPRAEPGDRPSFVVQAERAERWRQPRVRAALMATILLGALGLVGQVGYVYRDLAAARFPALRPGLEQACLALGCTVGPARAIDSLAVESSGLVRVERSNIYRLTVALRNRAGIEVALPALDVSLTDSQGRVIARKVVRLAELGAQQATLGAGRELALQGTLQAAAASAGAPATEAIAGYTIDLFYP
jgi:predicted Zn finger-like uncharacterized protein